MRDYNLDKGSKQKFVIKTKEGEVEISWSSDQQPGFCPYCYKCIPFSSIVFKKESENGMEIYSGKDAVKTKKCGRLTKENREYESQIGECPYCHKTIPVREVIIKRKDK